MVWSPRSRSSSRWTPGAHVFRFHWSFSPKSARDPPGRRAFNSLWFSDHPSRPPFLRMHSFAPRTQGPCLNLKGKHLRLFKEQRGKASERLRSSPSLAQPRAQGAPLPLPGLGLEALGELPVPSPACNLRASLWSEGEGSQALA